MVREDAVRLRRLAVELRTESKRIGATVGEAEDALPQLASAGLGRLVFYGAAALLETFYTGVEKALSRVAATFAETLTGSTWHRQLLETMAMEIPKVRPAVLSDRAARALEPYLAFRHRFRNLYLFDLEQAPIRQLLEGIHEAWGVAAADLERFAAFLDELADA